MSTVDFWKEKCAETHAKLVETREQLARVNSAEFQRHSRTRDALLRACSLAESFVADDTCRHDHEKAFVLRSLREAIDTAGGSK